MIFYYTKTVNKTVSGRKDVPNKKASIFEGVHEVHWQTELL